jgi:serine/threonine protein kinase/class 3 adenylate cyclase
MSDLVGKTIGKFEITAELGGGGMAEVFKAYQPSLNRYVAIKVIHGFLAKNEEFLARFQREAQNVAALRHPNIVQVHDFDVEDGRPYMVMEFIDGQPLDQVSGQRQATGGWQLADVLQAISDVGYALAYAHKQEMIHRDIKPSNIMWAGTVDDRYILTDFGLAKLLTGQNFTATGTVMGTPAYMSPEQCQGAAGDARTDIYSLGIVLYELATGQLPFAADTQMGYIMKHIAEPPLPPDKVKPDLPTWLTAVILKALTKDPNDRYQTMAEMVADLQRVNDTMMVSPAAATVPVVTADVKTAITDNLRDKAQNVTQFFKTRREKADPAQKAKQTAEHITQFISSHLKKEEGDSETEPATEAQSGETGLTTSRMTLPNKDVLQEEIKMGLAEAKAALEAKHDQLKTKGVEAADRVRGRIQAKLEEAVAKTAAAHRKRYTVLVANYVSQDIEQPTATAVLQQIADTFQHIIEQNGGAITQLLDYGFVALFDTPGSDPDAPLRAIEAGLGLVGETAVIQNNLPHFNLRVGIHTGIVATNEVNSDTIELAKQVTQATPMGQVALSHATYRLVMWQVQTEKQEAVQTADKSLQLYQVLADV